MPVFPTTIWTTIRQAGEDDATALEAFASRYQSPVHAFVRTRGFRGSDADDICQDVFVRVLKGRVLSKADRDRGRFRSLLLSVTMHVIQDRLRKRSEAPFAELEPPDRDPDFDEGWVLHLTTRAMDQLREQGSPYYQILESHLHGQKQDRKKLWIARRKLASLIRSEVAYTCTSPAEVEEELAYLSRYLRPRQASDEPDRSPA